MTPARKKGKKRATAATVPKRGGKKALHKTKKKEKEAAPEAGILQRYKIASGFNVPVKIMGGGDKKKLYCLEQHPIQAPTKAMAV